MKIINRKIPGLVFFLGFILMGTSTFAATFLDEFTQASYNNSNGTLNWTSTPWVETGDDDNVNSGRIYISGGALNFKNLDSAYIIRPVNLKGASSVTLTMDIDEDGNTRETLRIEIYNGTTGVWDLVKNVSNDTTINYTIQDGQYTSEAKIKFSSGSRGWGSNDRYTVDNIKFEGTFPDADGDGVPDSVDIDDDNDGILDVNEGGSYQTDSYSASGSSSHSFTYTYADMTTVQIDLNLIDNAFNVEIEGTTVLNNGKYLDLEMPSDTSGSRLVFADGTTMDEPWVANTEGLPRVRM